MVPENAVILPEYSGILRQERVRRYLATFRQAGPGGPAVPAKGWPPGGGNDPFLITPLFVGKIPDP
jgi:hypothetical protein